MGNPDTEFGDILLKDAILQLKSTAFDLSNMKGLKFDNVMVNGVGMATPLISIKPIKDSISVNK